MALDLKQLFPDTKFPSAEELKAKEDSFSIGDRVKVVDNIRCIQNGKIGTIVQIEPEDEHGWKSFIVKFDDRKYGAMGFNSGDINKIDERRNTMKKSTLRKRLVKEHFPKKIELRDFIKNNIEDKDYDDFAMFVEAEFGFDLYHEDPYGLWSEEELNSWLSAWLKDREDPEGKGLMNENTKVTLALGQLKKLINESVDELVGRRLNETTIDSTEDQKAILKELKEAVSKALTVLTAMEHQLRRNDEDGEYDQMLKQIVTISEEVKNFSNLQA